uniref:Cysteine rich protein 1 n=1 Tax=Anolis carolinensis TaxID=28377 RepID=G1KVA2_ANOCA
MVLAERGGALLALQAGLSRRLRESTSERLTKPRRGACPPSPRALTVLSFPPGARRGLPESCLGPGGRPLPWRLSRASASPAHGRTSLDGCTMPKCPRCQKEVYFAEKVTSLGKDWHRPCLKCEKCNKTLSAGGHAEHDGKPYCNHPCYAALFGPKGFGRGGAESHTFK